ncbi:MAG: NAD(+) synthase [Ruminococcaceae bacterium]|nr:NAD(+) synthase [Oscillospiraceae bacterium]
MKNGFVRVGCCSPRIRVADCTGNASKIIEKAAEMHARGVRAAVFPELCVTGATCGDLFGQDVLLRAAERAVITIAKETAELDMLLLVGVPVAAGCRLYSCAAAICRGKLLCLTAKTNIPNYGEHSEKRWFSPAPETPVTVDYAGTSVLLGSGLLMECVSMPRLVIGAELGADLTSPRQPGTDMALNGATLICNLSAEGSIIGRTGNRTDTVKVQSGRLNCAYALVNAGEGESTGDLVFSGHCVVGENGVILAQQNWEADGFITADIDVELLHRERRSAADFGDYQHSAERIPFDLDVTDIALERRYERLPFVPEDSSERDRRSEEILTMQSRALATRLSAINCRTAVLGLSGGLDSTLALIVCARTFDYLGLDRKGIIAVTMPCFGTTNRTKSNACRLADAYGVTLRDIPITEAAKLHLSDIGHDGVTTDVTYENAQARERTQILMDIANMENGIVIGTGDLSEMALGWATYNGDHMSMYSVNCDIPKTLIRYIVLFEAGRTGGELGEVLTDVYNTPVSPELLPPKDGDISQKTEDIVGPYELHDFFLYYFVRYGFEPAKIYRIARHAFEGQYDGLIIKGWLKTFMRRFFTQQFKRSCVPDGPKVGSVAMSPRGDWRMPSDACSAEWLKLVDEIDPEK